MLQAVVDVLESAGAGVDHAQAVLRYLRDGGERDPAGYLRALFAAQGATGVLALADAATWEGNG